MPIYYEPLDTRRDVTTTRTILHEVIPLTGTIISGTYSDNNIKNYSHGMFQSVYDYPYLSSSANHIFDLTMGYDESSTLSGSAGVLQEAKKINLYNQYSQVMLGYTGSANTVRLFESDLTLDGVGSMKEVMFLNFSRLLVKDEIKKGSFSLTVGTGSWADSSDSAQAITLADVGASSTAGTLSTNGGDYGVLYDVADGTTPHGIVFYQAGIAILSSSLFVDPTDFYDDGVDSWSINQAMVSGTIEQVSDALRHRIQNIQFNNSTEINSTIYFCRIPNNKFNYSSNPTYLNAGEIRIKNSKRENAPIAYVTTIGLYNSNRELLAVAKLSEPLRKDPTNELTLRVRLDY